MIAPNFENTERPDPIQERVGLGMFTDREQELASLMEWVEWVSQKFGRSQALVSHRRYGKTAIMERLYNRLFWERDDVMPFYFELGEHGIWIEELAETYLYSFLQQFLAYRTRQAELAFAPKRSFDHLYAIAEKAGETQVMETIKSWIEDHSIRKRNKMMTVLHEIPHYFATRTGLSIIVMFDEFQRLDQYIYFDQELTRQYLPLTGSFATAAESSWAPMLIAGSQVTLLTQQALKGAMLGRVGVDYIKRLPLAGAAELVLKFVQRRRLAISLDLAYTIGRLVDGHPYYVWCLFHSKYRAGDLTTEEGVRETLTFEVEDRAGYINEFWQYTFLQNMETFDRPHAKEMILYLTQYPDTEVYVEQLVEDLGLSISVKEANQILRELIWCDLVRERSRGFYGGLSDPMLARILRIEYGWEIAQIMRDEAIEQMKAELVTETNEAKDEIIAKLKGELRYWVGRFAEMFIDKVMKQHFNDQRVDGTLYFNHPGEILMNRFERVYTTMTQPAGATRPYQIDLYGIPTQDDDLSGRLPWAVEVKNWQKPVNKPDVEHFWTAAQNLAADKGHAQMMCWFYSRSGFRAPAKEFLTEKGILYTDQDSLERLLRDFRVVETWDEGSEQ